MSAHLPDAAPGRLFRRGSWTEASRVAEILRRETVGGALLLLATAVALIWANSAAADRYFGLRDTPLGPSALHLDLTLGAWASDGLLAIFFFLAGLELKREFVAGDLRDPRRAVLPVAAAVGGVVTPALIYVGVMLATGTDALPGWAVPVATDIAFALAVLAMIGSHLPSALRTFLLTLAVVDDLIAIAIIAIGYTSGLDARWLLLAALPLAGFALVVRRRPGAWWLLLPLAGLTWALVHGSGVHATVAGVLLGLTVPVAGSDVAHHLEHRLRPFSAGVAVPVFAFFAAGVAVGGWSGLRSALTDPVTIGIAAGLVAGKTGGVLGTTWLLARFTRAELSDELTWSDLLGLAVLAGIGFTVSLLIGELAFGLGSAEDDHAKVAVLLGSATAAVLATVLLRARDRAHRRMRRTETADRDQDGIPDVYQDDGGPDGNVPPAPTDR